MKKLTIFIPILLMFTSMTQAQKLGVGGMINHTSTGILFSYSPDWKGKWNLDLGMRFFTKVNLIGKNEEHFAYYQQGYTESFFEKFAANIRVSHKITGYKFIRLDFMANLLLTCEGRLETGHFFRTDATTGKVEETWLSNYFKPSPAAELTIGPVINIDCSPRLSIYGVIGFGVIYMHHSHQGWSRTDNEPITIYDIGPTLNWKRGTFELVGAEGLPMISFGMKYKLK